MEHVVAKQTQKINPFWFWFYVRTYTNRILKTRRIWFVFLAVIINGLTWLP